MDNTEITNELPVFDPCTYLPENSWYKDAAYRPKKNTVNELRQLMESIKPSEIRFKDLKWIAKKYTSISSLCRGGGLSVRLLTDSGGLLFGRYIIALENELKRNGIQYRNYAGITTEGWETFFRKQYPITTAKGFKNLPFRET